VLSEILSPLGIAYEIVNDKIILKPAKPADPLANGSSDPAQTLPGITVAGDMESDTLIQGRVVDNNGMGLANASVQLKGTSYGTTTNNEGFFISHTGR